MSTDTQRIADGIKFVHELWATLLEAGLAIFLLQRQVGALAVAPIGIALGQSIDGDPFAALQHYC